MNMTDPITSSVQTFVQNPWVLLFIAIGGILIVIGYSTSFFKYLYDYTQRERITAKKQHTEHCDRLFKQFSVAFDNTRHIHGGFNLDSFFNLFSYKDQFLRHLFTGHNEVFTSIITMTAIDRQIRTQREIPSQQQKQESDRTRAEFKAAFEKFTKDVMLKNKTFDGVCDDCKDNYEKAYKTIEMTEKLKSFTMPF